MVSFKANRDVAFDVKDLAEAEKFYGQVMGLKLVEKKEDTLIYDAGYLTFYIKESPEIHPPVLSFRVENLDQAKKHLTDNGCEIIIEWGRALYFKDPQGITHDIIEEKNQTE